MTIRKAKLKDIKKITEYGVQLIKQHHALDPYFAESKNIREVYQKFFKGCIYSKNKLLLVAEENGKVIGYAVGKLSSRPAVYKIRKIGHISDVFVEKNSRKLGIAKQFLQALQAWFKTNKIKHIELSVHVKNEVGKNAWSKYGLEDCMITKKVEMEKFNIT